MTRRVKASKLALIKLDLASPTVKFLLLIAEQVAKRICADGSSPSVRSLEKKRRSDKTESRAIL